MLRLLTAGESHGKALVAVLEGLPAGIEVRPERIERELVRRRHGHGRSGRQRWEGDRFEVLGGLRHGRTLGSPVAILIQNAEWESTWKGRMAPFGDPDPAERLTRPRPGHADLAGVQKYGFDDVRNVLERASARETAARVAAGAVCRALLDALGVAVLSHVVRIGAVATRARRVPSPEDLDAIDASPVRCLDPGSSDRMVAAIDEARREGDSLGGVFEVVAHGLSPGLGSHVHYDRKLDGRLALALMSIQAIKGVEVGDGFASAARRGSGAHDEIEPGPEGPRRRTGRAGGVEGGMTTGDVLRVRAAMKPISTLPRPLATMDLDTGEPARGIRQRTDACAVPAAGVVGEAAVALVLADALLEKFGGDSLPETRRNLEAYRRELEELR